VTGGMLAMLLTRLYGRPLAERMVGRERLARWEGATYSQSALVWGLILIAPIGDLPYFLAGLSRVGFAKIFALTLLLRVPAVFVVAAAGAGVMLLPWWQLALIFLALVFLTWVLARNRGQLFGWIDRKSRFVQKPVGSIAQKRNNSGR
jgi:uncharacterized membrane protein YdjX (TVP38/TMEM64 family)